MKIRDHTCDSDMSFFTMYSFSQSYSTLLSSWSEPGSVYTPVDMIPYIEMSYDLILTNLSPETKIYADLPGLRASNSPLSTVGQVHILFTLARPGIDGETTSIVTDRTDYSNQHQRRVI